MSTFAPMTKSSGGVSSRSPIRGVERRRLSLFSPSRNTHPVSRKQIGKRKEEHDEQRTDSADYDCLRELRTVSHVHEEEHDERCLETGDRNGDDQVETAQVYECHP